jgi:hypothetical protein
MRTRTRNTSLGTHTELGQSINSLIYYGNGTTGTASTVMPAFTCTLGYVLQRMTDETSRPKRSNKVVHRKCIAAVNTAVGPFYDPVYTSPWGYVEYERADPQWIKIKSSVIDSEANLWSTNSDVALPPRWNVSSAVANENSLKEDCIQAARQLKADLLLNIVEANQIWPAIRAVAGLDLARMSDQWIRNRKVWKSHHAAFNIVKRQVPGNFLAYKFGIAPLIHDIKDTVTYAHKLRSDMERFDKQETFRYSRSAEMRALFDSSTQHIAPLNGYQCVDIDYAGAVLDLPRLRYVLVVKPKIRFKSDLMKKIDFVVSRFSTSPADLAWEKIPFSFVVDWFIDLRGMCRKIDETLGFSPFDVVNFSRSYSYEVETSKTLVWRSSSDGHVLNTLNAGYVIYKHYERIPVSTDNILPIWRPRFGKSQAALSAALITQQLNKVRTKR